MSSVWCIPKLNMIRWAEHGYPDLAKLSIIINLNQFDASINVDPDWVGWGTWGI